MTTTTQPVAELNGVPVAKLHGTVAKLTEQPELAAFRFSARCEWIEGTATMSTIDSWFGVGAEHPHAAVFTATSDHPTLGHGHGPTPHEFVLHALASCISAGVATTAASRGITLTAIDATISGDMDVRGILGIDPDVRNGFDRIELEVAVEGDADRADLDALVAASTKRSAVFDLLTNPVTVVVAASA